MGLGKLQIVSQFAPVRITFMKYFEQYADEVREITRHDEIQVDIEEFRPDILIIDTQILKDGIIIEVQKILSIHKRVDIILFGKIWRKESINHELNLLNIIHLPSLPDDLSELRTIITELIRASLYPLVAVVEDDKTVNDVICEFLKKNNYRYSQCMNGKDTIFLFQYKRPGILILDLGLPDIDGFQLLSKLRSKRANISTIVISAKTDKDTVLKCKEQRTAAFIPKPVDFNNLLDKIEAIRLGFLS